MELHCSQSMSVGGGARAGAPPPDYTVGMYL